MSLVFGWFTWIRDSARWTGISNGEVISLSFGVENIELLNKVSGLDWFILNRIALFKSLHDELLLVCVSLFGDLVVEHEGEPRTDLSVVGPVNVLFKKLHLLVEEEASVEKDPENRVTQLFRVKVLDSDQNVSMREICVDVEHEVVLIVRLDYVVANVKGVNDLLLVPENLNVRVKLLINAVVLILSKQAQRVGHRDRSYVDDFRLQLELAEHVPYVVQVQFLGREQQQVVLRFEKLAKIRKCFSRLINQQIHVKTPASRWVDSTKPNLTFLCFVGSGLLQYSSRPKQAKAESTCK